MAAETKILLKTWCLIIVWTACWARECSDTWILGVALDFDATADSNATYSHTRIYMVKNTTQCANDCCQEIHGECDLAVYTESSTKRTCTHFQCFPIERCKFKISNESESYIVSVSATEKQSLGYIGEQTTLSPDHFESAHGDGTKSKGRKGALPEELPMDEAPLKHDNTTIVPRKGVEPSASMTFEAATASFNNTYLQSGGSDGQNPTNTTKDNLTDPFFEVEEAEPQTTTKTLKPSYTAPPVTSSSTLSYTHIDTTSQKTTTSERQFLPEVLTTTSVLPTLNGVGTRKETLNVIHSSATQTPVTQEPLASNGTVVRLDSSGEKMPEEYSSTAISFRNSPNMHLVIALVIGLLVLLSVIGLVGKRVHDSWLRRHYHRMDFLIDGMYHAST